MRLSYLLADYLNLPNQHDCEFNALQMDSRKINTHDVFFAIAGSQTNGSHYIDEALKRGACAVIYDKALSIKLNTKNTVPMIPLGQLKNKIGQMAAKFHQFPAKKLHMIGVTGTNGKTSCTHFLAQCLDNAAIPCGMIGTLGYGFCGHLSHSGLTTPDPISLQKILHEFVQQKVKTVVMEVSSHSIDQERISGVEFDVGIFTNLTQDHLDYHKTMRAYAGVKKRFFKVWPIKHIILNYDDDYGRRWSRDFAQTKSVYMYSLYPIKNRKKNVVFAKTFVSSSTGIKAAIHSPWGEGDLTVSLLGEFNLSNCLACLTALCLMGFSFDEACSLISKVTPVPGRMQTLGGKNLPLVVIDYSHTPDALEKALITLKKQTKNKLYCVFGCGGERDQGKRPLMAEIAERYADSIIVTNDNPRHEDPKNIAQQILSGFTSLDKVIIELDRTKAIENSIQWAAPQDCVLIAGKGAERYQQIGDQKLPFDDIEVSRQVLQKWRN